jgi:hypothetical protein
VQLKLASSLSWSWGPLQYAKNDSLAGGSIPVLQQYEYFNDALVCVGGNCSFKDFE